jgi:hypothetical protein
MKLRLEDRVMRGADKRIERRRHGLHERRSLIAPDPNIAARKPVELVNIVEPGSN